MRSEEIPDRSRIIRRASLIALIGNAFLATLKIATGLITGSLAVAGDGIDSSTDVIVAIITLVVSRVIAAPADADHPWGHGRAETVATVALSFILFFAGGQLVLNAISSLFSGEPRRIPGTAALIVTAASIVGKLFLAWSQFTLAKKAKSAMLEANGKNMRGDVLISGAVLIGLGVSTIFGLTWADPVIAFLVGLWIIKSALGIFREANLELMDGTADRALYSELFAAVRSVPMAGNPHRARIRNLASAWDIDLDIEVDGNMSVRDAHSVAAAVEKAIRERIDNVYDIVVHVEPAGDAEKTPDHTERYGLDEASVAASDGEDRA